MREERIVLSLGGNALERDGNPFSIEAIDESAELMRALYEARNKFAVVHGNGPQYGVLAEIHKDMSPAEVIEETQRLTAFYLRNSFYDSSKLPIESPLLVETHVAVDQNDPSFTTPVKGVGVWQESKDEFEAKGQTYMEHPGGYNLYRRTVPSPDVCLVLEIERINRMVASNAIPICGGGGGIPVVRREDQMIIDPFDLNNYVPVQEEVIIDKDLVAAEIAKYINGKLIIVTSVPGVFENFGAANQNLVPEMSIDDAYQYLTSHENDGGMWPKIKAAANHAESGGTTIITDHNNAMDIISNGHINGSNATVVFPVVKPNAA